jgi:phage FluMu gp28-like protein
MNPLDLLLPYQRGWVEDASPLKIWLASRQIGKSFSAACEVAFDCMVNPGTAWMLLSISEDLAIELGMKVKQWLAAFDLVIASENMETIGGTFSKTEIVLGNGSRIIVRPARPGSVRSFSTNLLLDEFAFHQDSREIWRAVAPSITNQMRGQLKLRILSTPNGQSGPGEMFYSIWRGEAGDQWSRHRTTIHEAVAAGLRADIAKLRAIMADADGWRQEFECEFIDSTRVAFPYDLIAKCEDPRATLTWPTGHTPAGILHVGIDVGSLRDPTVCLTLEADGSRRIVREVLILEGMELADQVALLSPRIHRAARASIDASGIGLDISQRLRRTHGGKVIAQPVSAKWKRTAFQALQSAMADALLALPADRRFRDDLHAYEVHGAGESASFRAPRTEEGHSDITSALVHAWDAAAATGTGAFSAEDAAATLTATTAKPRFQPRRIGR